jgi:hypothetical protein
VQDGLFSASGVDFSTNLEIMPELNYTKVMESVKGLIQHWSKRNLTVFGRITVVKSLLIPKFNHLVLSIPNPSADFVNSLQKQIYNFIWKGKRDKISRDQLSNDYSQGGLRLVNVDLFFQLLKSTWIRRIVNGNIDANGLVLFSKFTGMNIADLEKGANYTLTVARKTKNIFWKEILLSWSKLKKKHIPNTLDDVLKSYLWDNDLFQIGGKEINYKKWRTAGIDFISDLVHTDKNRFLFLNEIEVKYGLKINPLDYNGVLRSVKSKFKQLFQTNTMMPIPKPFIPFHFSLILKDKKGCRSLCSHLRNVKAPTAKQKWGEKLGLHFTDEEWKTCCLMPFKCTMEVKLRWFQYRILNRILTTNTFMYTIGQRNDNLCTFCNREPETIKHLFTECEKVKNIWAQLQTWLLQKLGFTVIFNKNHILFGTELKKTNHAANLILILTKFHIYRRRCQNVPPLFTLLKKEIENYHKLERFIFLKDSNFQLYQSKWQVWSRLFS